MKGPEEFTLNFDGRQTRKAVVRSVDVRFADDKVKSMNETIRASLDDLLKAQGDISYVQGVKGAAEAFANMILASDIRLTDWPKDHLEPWLAHVVAMKGECGCFIESDYDNSDTLEFCKHYEDKDYRRLWFLGYHGMTEGELVEQEREAQRQRAEAKARAQAEEKEARRQRLLELAEEFNVDPKYLP